MYSCMHEAQLPSHLFPDGVITHRTLGHTDSGETGSVSSVVWITYAFECLNSLIVETKQIQYQQTSIMSQCRPMPLEFGCHTQSGAISNGRGFDWFIQFVNRL